MGIEKTRKMVKESIYWMNINADIEDSMITYLTCLGFKQIQPKVKIVANEEPGKSWDVIGTVLFNINNSNFLCVLDYNS